jgi:hypothetical protein
MRNYNIGISLYALLLGVYSLLADFYSPLLIASISAIPIYMYGNKIARDKGLDTNNKDERPKDPFVRLRNFAMSGLPFAMVIFCANILI